MGWWWSSSQDTEDPPTQPRSQHEPFAPEPPTSTPDIADRPRQLTRDEQADADLKELLAQFSTETATHASTRTSRADGSDTTSTTSTSTTASSDSISPDSLFPTSMSCRQAFDSAFYCQSVGGQFNNIYRYGGLRDCSANWWQFWFCMRARSRPEETRRRMIQDHYRQRAVKYKVGPSSEDVWEVRTEPVVDAFRGDLEALEREEREGEGELGRVEREELS